MTASVRKYLFAIGAYLLALPVVGIIAFFVVIFLAGPHAGLFPQSLEAVILILGWLSVLGLPAWVAVRVWRRVDEVHTAQSGAPADTPSARG